MNVRPFKQLSAWVTALSLRTGLTLFLVLIAVLLLADRTREVVEERAARIESAMSRLAQVALQGADRQNDIIVEAQAVLRLVASLPESSLTSRSCNPTFARLSNELPWLTSLTTFDVNGTPLCSSTEPLPTANISDRQYFHDTLQHRTFTLSDYLVSRVTGKPILIAALPRIEGEDIDTVLIGAIDVNWLSRLAAQTDATDGSIVLLLDRAGTIVASSSADDLSGQSLQNTDLFANVSRRRSGVAEASWLDGEQWIVAHHRLPRSTATVAVMQPKDLVLAEADRKAFYNIAKIVVVALAAFGVIWLGGERLVIRPVERLAKSAAQLGGGELSAHITTEGLSPEFRTLATALNSMAAEVAARDADLRNANEALQALAATDSLTGLANRRRFDDAMQTEWNRATREYRHVAVIALDVDNFKKFNDRFGHPAGDACLKAVAAVLATNVRRAGELAGRVGGEEFSILMPGCDLEQAVRFAEKLRREVEALDIEHPDNVSGRVTISAGTAAVKPLRGDQPAMLLDLADQALYSAKRSGRNQVKRIDQVLSLAS